MKEKIILGLMAITIILSVVVANSKDVNADRRDDNLNCYNYCHGEDNCCVGQGGIDYAVIRPDEKTCYCRCEDKSSCGMISLRDLRLLMELKLTYW